MNLATARMESNKEFDRRIDEEEAEARIIACPLNESCGAEIGEPCCTQSGQSRIRHARRLLEARKLNGN